MYSTCSVNQSKSGRPTLRTIGLTTLALFALAGCEGDDGAVGATGAVGPAGPEGPQSEPPTIGEAFVWDARSEGQYAGTAFQNNSSKQGHPKGAVWLNYNTLVDPETWEYRPKSELADLLDGKEVDGAQFQRYEAGGTVPLGEGEAYAEGDTIITYCETTFRAMVTGFTTAAILGYPTRFYDGAMVEWNSLSHMHDEDGDYLLPSDSPWRTDNDLSHYMYADSTDGIEGRTIPNPYATHTNVIIQEDYAYKKGKDYGAPVISATPADIARESADDYNDNENGLITAATLQHWIDNWGDHAPEGIDGNLIILQVNAAEDDDDEAKAGSYITDSNDGVTTYVIDTDRLVQTRFNGVKESRSMVPSGEQMDAFLGDFDLNPTQDMIVWVMGEPGAGHAMRQGRGWYAFRYWGVAHDHLAMLNGGADHVMDESYMGDTITCDERINDTCPPGSGTVTVKDLPEDNTALQATLQDMVHLAKGAANGEGTGGAEDHNDENDEDDEDDEDDNGDPPNACASL